MKKFLAGLALVVSILFGGYFGNLIAVTPGRDLIPPTAFSHLTEDNIGNMTFQDAVQGPLTLNQIANIPSVSTITVKNNQVFGTAGVSLSTVPVSGNSNGSISPMFLDVGNSTVTAIIEGSALCASTGTSNTNVTVMNCPQIVGYQSFFGIAQAPASTGTVVNTFWDGVVLALTTGTVNPGDPVVVSSQSLGYLETWSSTLTSGTNTICGIALARGKTSGGLTKIRLR